MSSSLRRSRFRARVPDEDPIAAEDAEIWSRSSTKSSTDASEYDADLESMTGKGIKRLCSELLELKKASDRDFQRNVYSNYSAFVRIFEQVEGLESEIMEMKKHVSTQSKLIQTLTSNLYADMVMDGLKEMKVEDSGLNSSSRFGIHMQDILVTLDILLSECQLKEALAVLEKETLTLQKLQIEEDHSSPIIMSYTYALSQRRMRLADQLALVAEHPRVSQPELQKALSGLCRLGENYRANSLLLKFYRSHLQKKVHELHCSKPCLYGTHIRELAKVVFSAISQSAKCFVVLNGEASLYSSELILWAREEAKTFGHNFNTYVRSISELNGGLSVAVEAAKSALLLCSLLNSQRIVLMSDLMELIRPCMQEVLQRHVDHLKKVVHIFTTTDNWTLGKFLCLGILRDKSYLTGIGDKADYCLLTSSGRKFVSLMQAIVDDISPLVILRMGSSILKGLFDLFREYMCDLERAIPRRGSAVENDSPKVNSARTLQQQLSLLANASTLVHFFSSISGSIFEGKKSSNDNLLLEQTEIFSKNELDDWMLSIKEAADQLRCNFCQQFVFRVMSRGYLEYERCLDDWIIPSTSQDSVPSFAFQALFVRLRQLEQLSKSIYVGEDGMMDKLPKEIVETVIVWLSNEQELWTKTVEHSCIRHCSCFEQVYLDMHFLVEIASLGGYCSNDLIIAVMDLIEEMEVAFTTTGSGPDGVLPDRDDCSLNAAKLAIKKLLAAEAANLEHRVEPVAIFLKDSRTQDWEDECSSNAEDSVDISEASTAFLDGESENSVDDGITRLIEIKDAEPKSFEGQTSDVVSTDYDDDGSRSPTFPYSDREEDADRADTGTDGLGGSEELELERLSIKDEVQSVGNLDGSDAIVAQPVAEEAQVILGKENLVLENELLENSMVTGQEGIVESEAEVLATNPEGESVGSLYECDAIAVKLTTEEPDISRKETVVMKTGHIEAGKLKEVKGSTQQLVEQEPESIVNGDRLLSDNFSKLVLPTSLQNRGNIIPIKVSGNASSDSVGQRGVKGHVITPAPCLGNNRESSNALDSKTSSEIKISSGVLDGVSRLDLEKELVRLEDNSSPEVQVQVDRSKLKDEPAIFSDKQPSDNFSQLVLAVRPQNQGEGGVIHVEGSGNTSGDSAGQRAVVKRRSQTFAPRLGTNANGSNGMNSKISSDVHNPSDVPVKPTRLDLEKELVMLEDDTSPSTMVQNLDRTDWSKVEGELVLFEPQSILGGNKLLSSRSSDLVFERSLQKQGKYMVGPVEGSGSISSDSLLLKGGKEQSQAASGTEKNEKGLGGSDSLVEMSSLDLEKKIDLLEADGSMFSKSEELVQDDGFKAQVDLSIVKDKTTMHETQRTEEEENLLTAKFSELALETSLQKLGSDNGNLSGSSKNPSGDLVRQRGGRKRTKSISEENRVKSRKGAKALRPSWH